VVQFGLLKLQNISAQDIFPLCPGSVLDRCHCIYRKGSTE